MRGILSRPRSSLRNEYRHRGVQYDTFSMMYSSCLLLLNLRRKGLKPNTSVKSMNHSLFISFNWGVEGGEKICSLKIGCVVPYFFFLLWPDEKKKIQRSLFIRPPLPFPLLPLSLLWESWTERETWSGTGRNQTGTPYTTARSHGSRKCPAPLPSPLSGVHHSPSFHSFPSPPRSLPLLCPYLTNSPSSPPPQHLPALTPDTVLPLRFHPFPAQPACCGGGVVALPYWLHILSPAFLTPTSAPHYRASKKWISPSLAHFLLCMCVCVCRGECVGECEQWYHIQLNMPNDD